MSIGEIFILVVSILTISAVGFIAWLFVMIFGNKTQPLNQNETDKNESESKPELPNAVDNFFDSAWPMICCILVGLLGIAAVFFVGIMDG